MEIFWYGVILLIGLIIPLGIAVYGLFGIISDLKGAPYVPTSAQMVEEILAKAQLKQNLFFLELGSGDGRVVRQAVKKYQVRGLGIDINIPLIYYAKLINLIQHINGVDFKTGDIFKTDLSHWDVIFVFLLPETLRKLSPKFQSECKKGTLIISHGFKIEGMEELLIDQINRKLFPTYFYKIK